MGLLKRNEFVISISLVIFILLAVNGYINIFAPQPQKGIILGDIKSEETFYAQQDKNLKFLSEGQFFLYSNKILYKAEVVPEEDKVYIYKSEPVGVSTKVQEENKVFIYTKEPSEKFLEENKIYIYENGTLISTKFPEDEREDLAIAINKSFKVLDKFENEGEGKPAIGVPIELEPAPDLFLNKTKEYMAFYVGEKYFDEHIFVKKSWAEPKVDKIGAKYGIHYTYKFKIKEDLNETSVQFILWLDPNGNLVEYRGIEYRGPQKPYSFNISRREAEDIARKQGIGKIATIDVVFGLLFYSNEGVINESYIWYVSSENPAEGEPEVIYIGVDSGEVVGILTKPEAKTVLPIE